MEPSGNNLTTEPRMHVPLFYLNPFTHGESQLAEYAVKGAVMAPGQGLRSPTGSARAASALRPPALGLPGRP